MTTIVLFFHHELVKSLKTLVVNDISLIQPHIWYFCCMYYGIFLSALINMEHHIALCSTLQHDVTPCTNMQFPVAPCSTMQLHTIQTTPCLEFQSPYLGLIHMGALELHGVKYKKKDGAIASWYKNTKCRCPDTSRFYWECDGNLCVCHYFQVVINKEFQR